MSIMGLLNIGNSALIASQTALSVTSNNIANVNTPGFDRQDVILDVSSPPGSGVTVSGITTSYDGFIQSQLIGQSQNQGRSSALATSLSQVETAFTNSTGLGLSTALTDYFNAWNDVATTPDGQAQRTVLLQKANSLVLSAQSMESGMTQAYDQTNNQIKGGVDQINVLASQIASLNGGIANVEAGSNSPKAYDLRNQRDNLMNQLASLTQFSSYEDKTGAVTVTMGMRTLVSGEKTNTLSSTTDSSGDQQVYLDSVNITSDITKGKLGGLIAARDAITSGPLTGLRKLVASVTKEVNLVQSSGYGLDGSTGNNFFNPLQLSTTDSSAGASVTSASVTNLSQLTLDEYNIAFDAPNHYSVTDKQTGSGVASGTYTSGNPISFDGIQVTITGAATANDSFSVSPLTGAIRNFGVAVTDPSKIAASSSNMELPGNNQNALQLAQLANTAVANIGGASFSDFYGGLVSNVGIASGAASDSLTFDNNMMSELQGRRDSASGVSLDQEAVNLVQYQRSYEAAAQMIKIADQLLQTVLTLTTPAA